MAKKEGWSSAIKRVFLSCHRNPASESEERATRDKKGKELGKPKYGKTKSFIPRFREPSSIEQILRDAERENNLIFQPPMSAETPNTLVQEHNLIVQPPTSAEIPKLPVPESSAVSSTSVVSPKAISPKASSNRPASPRGNSLRSAASPRTASPKIDPARATSSRSLTNQKEIVRRPEPELEDQHASATKIQATYKGFVARRSFRALKGLVRLHGVMRGNNVKQQTTDAVKYMQMSVRLQSQIRSRRIEMFESKVQIRSPLNIDRDAESHLGKWSSASEFSGRLDIWDDSTITKEERDARVQRRTEAIINKERAKAYAYSNQLTWKLTTRSSSSKIASTDVRSDGFPWWWSRLDNHLPPPNHREDRSLKSFRMTPPRSNPRSSFKFENFDASTPKSSRSSVPISSRRALTPPSGRILVGGSSSSSKYSRQRLGPSESPFNNGSFISCPPFSDPHYMTATASTKAKVRASSNPRDRPGTPGSETSRRFSFPMTPSSRTNHGSLRTFDANSVVDTPASSLSVGRKPFNRFV